MNQNLFTPGEYFVGDPCYLFGHDPIDSKRWMDLLEDSNYFKNYYGQVDGVWVVAMPTAYGDGTYVDNFGREYGVDAGLIGITPAKFFPVEKGAMYAMHKITFDVSFDVWDDTGVLHFGNVIIDTVGEDD